MRHYIILSLLFSVVFCYVEPEFYDEFEIDPFALENTINSTIEGLRPNISDPLLVDLLELSFPPEDGAVVVGDGTISNLRVAGLKSFQVSALHYALVGAELNITVILPTLDVYTDFDLNLTVVDTVPIYGLGNISLYVDRLEVVVSAIANLTGGISVHDLRLQLHIDNATVGIHGLFDDEELSTLLTSIINDLAVTLIDDNQELITQLLSPLVEGILNSILGGLLGTTTPVPTTTALPTTAAPKIGLK